MYAHTHVRLAEARGVGFSGTGSWEPLVWVLRIRLSCTWVLWETACVRDCGAISSAPAWPFDLSYAPLLQNRSVEALLSPQNK